MASTKGGPSSSSKKVQAHEEKSVIVSQHMQEGMNALSPGIAALAERCQQNTVCLEKGVKHLDEGVKHLDEGVKRLDKGVKRVAKLTAKLDARVDKLQAKIQRLQNAMGNDSEEDVCSSAIEDN